MLFDLLSLPYHVNQLLLVLQQYEAFDSGGACTLCCSLLPP